MKRAALLAAGLVGLSALWGCRSGPESVYTRTETTEKVVESSILEPGTPPSEEQEPQEKITIRTQTEERVIEEEPAVK